MISDKKAFECVQTIVQFCAEQDSCQNCIFRKHGASSWNCHVDAYELERSLMDIEGNRKAKRKNGGYI